MEIKHKINILLVDDHFENLLSLEALLDSPHYHIVKAKSGEEALKYLLRDEYAVILLDVQMPGINGFETARLIKERRKTKAIPIIFVTAINKEPEHVNTGYKVGAIDYMFKPLDPQAIRAKVQGFVNLYLSNLKVMKYAEALKRKTDELEKAYGDLAQAVNELRGVEAFARAIGETAMDSIVLFDEAGEILTMNPVTQMMFGPSIVEWMNQPIGRLIPSLEGITNFPVGMRFEANAVRPDNSSFPAEVHIGKTVLDEQRIFACTIRNMTDHWERLKELEYQASHDELTGLFKRALLYNTMNEIINQGDDILKPFAVCILDLDHFKMINDMFGHDVGDALLRFVATRLKHAAGERNPVVRLGGDEFAILIPDSSTEESDRKFNEIRKIFEEPYMIEGKPYFIHASTGIAHYPADGKDVHTLMRRADVLMYNAKRKRQPSFGFQLDHERVKR